MTKRSIVFLEIEVHAMINKKKRLMKGEVHSEILNQARRPPIKNKDPTIKMSQGRRSPRESCDDERDETILIRIPRNRMLLGIYIYMAVCDGMVKLVSRRLAIG